MSRSYSSTRDCVIDLERAGDLVRISEEISPDLVMAEVQRRVYAQGGPAILFERVEGSPFPAVSNLFGTLERTRFLFRHTLERVRHLVGIKADPSLAWRHWPATLSVPWTALTALPKRTRGGPILHGRTTIDQLPQIKSWPDDGGPFVTLPQVYTEDPDRPGAQFANLGMYRIQLGGNDYLSGREIGLHYQIHRGIGIHHTKALERGEPLRVSIFVGGPPASTFAAVMPLPEGLSELFFAGMLGGRRFRYLRHEKSVLAAEADFCITGTVDPARTKVEGPFGDHLGYYSLRHDFPVLQVEQVYHRKDAIWPFTVVGRPPQEDTSFGKLIHEITGPMVPKEIPGVHELHAVDAAGVHPLLLALGSERYMPFGERVPREILTLANAILGFNQCSLAKYLFIAAREDNPELQLEDLSRFFTHVLERIDLSRDLHFQTKTTMDTLDYSGTGLNSGSKLVVAAAGPKKRDLLSILPSEAQLPLPEGWSQPRVALPGIITVESPTFSQDRTHEQQAIHKLAGSLPQTLAHGFPLVVLVDDTEFAARNLRNFVWVTFTRSNPSHDLYGVGEFVEHKHWGCRGSLIIDARIKPHHAPPLVEDPAVTKKVEALAAPGKPLHGIL